MRLGKTRTLALAASALLPAVLPFGAAHADTLQEALTAAYQNNPTLAAARATQRATDEGVPIQKAAGRPSVTGTVQLLDYVKQSSTNFISPDRAINGQLNLGVPIFSGGAVKNGIRGAEARVDAGRADLRGTESDVFTQVVAAYMDVLRGQAVVGLQANQIDVLSVNLRATSDRFEIGDLTRTDVAQSQARLATSQSDFRTAQANLIASRETYAQLTGMAATDLQPPPPLARVSGQRGRGGRCRADAESGHHRRQGPGAGFRLRCRCRRGRPASARVGGYWRDLQQLPRHTGRGRNGRNRRRGPAGQHRSAGWACSSTCRCSRAGSPPRNAARPRRGRLRRSSRKSPPSGWLSRASVRRGRAGRPPPRSSPARRPRWMPLRSALEGVRAENSIGNRTILDALNAEQELLNARVLLVTARRNAYVAGFQLLAAMGRAEARDLGLVDEGLLYDPVANYNRVKGKWFDFSDDPAPKVTTTTTAAVPAANAEIPAADMQQRDETGNKPG